MKRLLSSFLLVTVFVMMFAVAMNTVVAAKAEYVIKLAHADAMDIHTSRKHAQAITFKHLVEGNSSGRIEVQVFGGGAVGGEREYVESVMAGSLQAGIASGVMANFMPEAMITDIPYLFPDAMVAWEVLDGPFGDKLSNMLLEKTGLKNLAFAEVGFRNFTNSVRPIHTPADMKGLKIRVMETPLYVTMVKALGANPTPIAWTECYSALQNGIVDGEENPVSTIVFANFAEVQKYLTLDRHVYGVDWFVMNNSFFESLPEDLQVVVQDAAKISSAVGRGIQQLNSAVGLETLKKAGMEIYSPTPEERKLFKEAAQGPVIEWVKTQVDPNLVDELLAEVDRVVAQQ
jgi:tripartite ATP-independent transporter DctP family solute receptor